MSDQEDTYGEPRDVWAERALAGALITGATCSITAEAWWDPHVRKVAETCLRLEAAGKPRDPVLVRAALLRAGERGTVVDGAWLANLVRDACMPAQVTVHAGILREHAARRDLMRAARRALQAATNPSTDPYATAAELWVTTGALADEATPPTPEKTTDAHEFIAGDDAYDWLVPGLLERGDRFLITGGEGSGKSYLSRQLAVTTAAGVHPFKGDRVPPARVTLVDLENGQRMLRRLFRTLLEHAQTIGRPIAPGMLTIESRPSGVDLTRAEDATWLKRLCDTTRPELLVIGPIYRMHAKDMNDEQPARLLTQVIDEIRAVHNCTVIMETHSPHGNSMGGQRSLRPVGSSLFMRWPEFGYGLRAKDGDDLVMNLTAWRGPRDDRDFPRMLIRGGPGEWPWHPYHGFTNLENGWAS